MTWDLTRYSQNYVQHEQQARADELGVRQQGCALAWEWCAGQTRGSP